MEVNRAGKWAEGQDVQASKPVVVARVLARREEAADGRCNPVYILRACTGSCTGAAGGKREVFRAYWPLRMGRARALAAFPSRTSEQS